MSLRTSPDVAPSEPHAAPVRRDPFDDMHDDPDGPPSPLPPRVCDPILQKYDPADQKAGTCRTAYVALAILTAIFGVCAVLLAIVELARDHILNAFHSARAVESSTGESDLVLGELFAVALMLLCWLLMLVLKSKWLARRHQAERYRQIKYQLLIGPEKWNDHHWLQEELKPIAAFEPGLYPHATISRLRASIQHDLPEVPFDIGKKALPAGDLRRLVIYYLQKRLTPQKDYLHKREGSNESWDNLFFWSELVLACGVLFPLLNGVYSLVKHDPAKAAAFLLAAACFPVAAAYLRTLRSSFEFSRNTSRFSAAHAALLKLQHGLDDDLKSIPGEGHSGMVDAADVLTKLHWSEYILATEHIEWLRLMIETELF